MIPHEHRFDEDLGPLPEAPRRFRGFACSVLIEHYPWEKWAGVDTEAPAKPCRFRAYRCRCCGTFMTLEQLAAIGVVPKVEEKKHDDPTREPG